MLNYFVGLQHEILGTTDLNNVYQGMVIEHIVGQELHNMAVRLYAGEILISTITTPEGKTVNLLNLPYYLVSQIEKYLEWFERRIAE